MKKGSMIRIVENRPASGQKSIAQFIGMDFEVLEVDYTEDARIGRKHFSGRVSVNLPSPFNGPCVLHEDEYQILP